MSFGFKQNNIVIPNVKALPSLKPYYFGEGSEIDFVDLKKNVETTAGIHISGSKLNCFKTFSSGHTEWSH